jgi:DNA repair photolyase
LALCDVEALQQAREFLRDLQITTDEFVFQKAMAGYQTVHAIRTQARASVERIRDLIAWSPHPSVEWSAGFLAGIFDAEGSYSQGILRISNTDKEIIAWISRCLMSLDFRFSVEQASRNRAKPIQVVRLDGGLREHLRFFHSVDPVITRKREMEGQAVKSSARLGIVSIEPINEAQRLFDITTETGDFIANGVVSHNCYARPSHAYVGLSAGLDFETKLFAKTNAAERLRAELAKPGYVCRPLALGSNTDPYQPIERRYRIMRQILEMLAECEHPLTIVTKSALIERDLDLLAPMARKRLVHAFISVTTLDRSLARRLEPRAAAPARRLEAVQRLAAAGVPVGVMVAPVIPALNDHDIENILEQARAAGADGAGYVLLRLPHEVKDLFREWLARHEPLRAEHVMSLVQGARGGRDNDPRFGARMRGTGAVADLIENRFAVACRRLGFNEEERELDCTRFRAPVAGPQLALF